MRRSQSNIIKFAARLVKCHDDTPEQEVKIRCEAANVIKDCYDEIDRLRAIAESKRRKDMECAMEKVSVKVICCMGDISLHVGESRIELSAKQATELAELLTEAVEFEAANTKAAAEAAKGK